MLRKAIPMRRVGSRGTENVLQGRPVSIRTVTSVTV